MASFAATNNNANLSDDSSNILEHSHLANISSAQDQISRAEGKHCKAFAIFDGHGGGGVSHDLALGRSQNNIPSLLKTVYIVSTLFTASFSWSATSIICLHEVYKQRKFLYYYHSNCGIYKTRLTAVNKLKS